MGNSKEEYNKRKEYFKEYKRKNRERIKDYHQAYRKTKHGRAITYADNYRRWDSGKGFDISNNITPQWIEENLFSENSKCVYCGDSDWQHLGADRIDNNKPHTPDNVVCACGRCNEIRAQHYTVEEFKELRKRVPAVLV